MIYLSVTLNIIFFVIILTQLLCLYDVNCELHNCREALRRLRRRQKQSH